MSVLCVFQTVYGEVLPIQSNTDIVGMGHFILTRLLGNPDIQQQFAHATVPHLYRDGESLFNIGHKYIKDFHNSWKLGKVMEFDFKFKGLE